MVINMKFSCIKAKTDSSSFEFLQGIGAKVFELEDLEKADETIEKLANEKYTTIFLTSEVAGFSENIIKKYKNNQKINIVITPSKRI